MREIANSYRRISNWLSCWLMPVIVLISRLWMAKIFWYSGLVKISSWEATVYLFANEYKVPILPPEVAAFCATTFELVCPVLLVLGLACRLATLPMLAMVAVIQSIYPADLNLYWALLLAMILCYGPGYLSADALVKRWMN